MYVNLNLGTIPVKLYSKFEVKKFKVKSRSNFQSYKRQRKTYLRYFNLNPFSSVFL